MGDRLREMLRAGGWTIVNETALPLVCFTHPSLETGRKSQVGRLVHEVVERRKVWISKVVLAGGRVAGRACVTSYRTGVGDLEVLMEELEAVRRGVVR